LQARKEGKEETSRRQREVGKEGRRDRGTDDRAPKAEFRVLNF